MSKEYEISFVLAPSFGVVPKEEAMSTVAPSKNLDRKWGLADVVFRRDDGRSAAFNGIRVMKSWEGEDGLARYHIETINADVAHRLVRGEVGTLHVRHRPFLDRKALDPEQCLGRFRVYGEPMVNGGHRALTSLTVRLIEER